MNTWREGISDMKAEAYKAGDVMAGNWQWAVGIPMKISLSFSSRAPYI